MLPAITSLRERIGVLFLAFSFLVVISVVAMFLAIETQQQDARVINLAGRQRMLLQAMTRHALEIEKHPGEALHREALAAASATFQSTLQALAQGGPAPYAPGQQVTLSPPQDPTVREELAQVQERWTRMQALVETVLTASPQDPAFQQAVAALEEQSLPLAQAMDEAVQAFERAATVKVYRLRSIQGLFLVAAISLVLLGYGAIYRMVVRPLRFLQGVAADIGNGQLSRPVPPLGQDEIGQLAENLETMRRRLQAAHEHLETQVAQRTRELEALYEVSREISSRLEIQHVLHSVTEKARDLLGGEVATLCLLEEDGATLGVKALSGPQQALQGSRVSVQNPLVAQVLTRDRALACGLEGCAGGCGILVQHFRTSHLAAPLRLGTRVIGALCVGSPQPNHFPKEAMGLLTKLADSAAIALENARLYEQAERLAVLEERQHIAAEMHDGLAQTLSFLGLKVDRLMELVEDNVPAEVVQELHRLRSVIDQASHEVRHAIASLQGESQPPTSLCDRLVQTVRELSTEGEGPSVELVADGAAALRLPPDEAEQVVRVVREAVVNARRHAGASRIWVRLEQWGREARIAVEDDGRGFDPEATARQAKGHFGLRIMRARAARIGGQVAIQSAPGEGTRVVLTWPLPRRQARG